MNNFIKQGSLVLRVPLHISEIFFEDLRWEYSVIVGVSHTWTDGLAVVDQREVLFYFWASRWTIADVSRAALQLRVQNAPWKFGTIVVHLIKLSSGVYYISYSFLFAEAVRCILIISTSTSHSIGLLHFSYAHFCFYKTNFTFHTAQSSS